MACLFQKTLLVTSKNAITLLSSIFKALMSLSAQFSAIFNGFSPGLTHKKLASLSLGEEEAQ